MDCCEPVTPRDAASLLLYRRRRDAVDVLLGKRASAHRFMPNVYVFPGGAVDDGDRHVVARGSLNDAAIAYMDVGRDASAAHALAMAAIRETFEEAGILVAESGEQLQPGAGESWQRIAGRGAIPVLTPLRYVARAITPTEQPIRFHARFFAVDIDEVPLAASMEPEGNGELEDLRWVDTAVADELPIHGVTRFVLDELQRLSPGRLTGWHGTRSYTRIDGKALVR